MNTVILGYNARAEPLILCEWRPDFIGGLRFWCEWCRRWHQHGRGAGHRAAHCSSDKSPCFGKDYVLVEPKEKLSFEGVVRT